SAQSKPVSGSPQSQPLPTAPVRFPTYRQGGKLLRPIGSSHRLEIRYAVLLSFFPFSLSQIPPPSGFVSVLHVSFVLPREYGKEKLKGFDRVLGRRRWGMAELAVSQKAARRDVFPHEQRRFKSHFMALFRRRHRGALFPGAIA